MRASAQSTVLPKDLLAEFEALKNGGQNDKTFARLMQVIDSLAGQVRSLQQKLSIVLRRRYSRSSERTSPDQLPLALIQMLLEAASSEESESSSESSSPESKPDTTDNEGGEKDEGQKGSEGSGAEAPKRKKRTRGLQNLTGLRREVEVVSVPEEQMVCEQCQTRRKPMGYEVQVTLEYTPPEFWVRETHREKCVCKRCEEGVVCAPARPKPLDDALPGSSVLAQLCTSKGEDACPVYRQQNGFRRSRVDLPRRTLQNWYTRALDMLEPLGTACKNDLCRRHLVSLDDTRMPFLEPGTPGPAKRGRLWVHLGDVDQVAYCEFRTNWKASVLEDVLGNFAGHALQGDGYPGFDSFCASRPNIQRFGCMDHARRGYVDAMKQGDETATVCVGLLRELYAIEARAKERGLDADAVREVRERQARPVLEKFRETIVLAKPSALLKGTMAGAISYTLNQWSALTAYIEDGRVPISNVHVERLIRMVALIRKNSMFVGSVAGGRRLATLLTVVLNVRLAGLCLFDYLRDIFDALAGGWRMARIAELLPMAWAARRQ